MSYTIERLIGLLPDAFQSENIKGVDAVIQLNVTGMQMGHWNIVIKNGRLNVVKGVHESPELTITMDTAEILDIANGKLDPTKAFTQGKARVNGDLTEAIKLVSLFRIREHA